MMEFYLLGVWESWIGCDDCENLEVWNACHAKKAKAIYPARSWFGTEAICS